MADPPIEPFLSRIPVFGGLSPEQLPRLARRLKEERYARGDVICRQGEPGRSMYVVRSGEVMICRDTEQGQRIRVVRLKPGDFFGDMTLIEMQPRSATVVAEVETTLLSLHGKDLFSLYQEDPDAYVLVLSNIARELSRRLRAADGRLAELAAGSDEAEDTQIGTNPAIRLR